jgi:hypothetical protein
VDPRRDGGHPDTRPHTPPGRAPASPKEDPIPLFLAWHRHHPGHCPAAPPHGALLMSRPSAAAAARHRVTILAEALLEDEHLLLVVVQAASPEVVHRFLAFLPGPRRPAGAARQHRRASRRPRRLRTDRPPVPRAARSPPVSRTRSPPAKRNPQNPQPASGHLRAQPSRPTLRTPGQTGGSSQASTGRDTFDNVMIVATYKIGPASRPGVLCQGSRGTATDTRACGGSLPQS